MRALPLILAACGAKAAAPPPTTPAPAPVVAVPPKPTNTPFGRYTVAAPEGYEVDARDIEIGFRRGDILIVALDGAELGTPPADKCESQLAAFAMGIVTGLARAETRVNVVSSKRLPNGCRLTGTTSGTPSAFIEAAVLDLGIEGPAVAFLVHARADDGASTVFEQVVTSIAKK
jgi:hypothetical protein